MKTKPHLKPIGSVAGIGERDQIRQYLIQQCASVGLLPYENGPNGLVSCKGKFNNQNLTVSFSILKLTKYVGLHQDQQVRYRTFQGIRTHYIMPTIQKTRLVVAKKTQGKWLKRITNWVMKYKKFKLIDSDFLGKEVYSPDEQFATGFINDKLISNTLNQLNDKDTQCISWGLILIPEQLTINTTYENLDEFETDKLQTRLSSFIKLVTAIENKTISQELSMNATEILARDNPKKLLRRGMWIVLAYVIFIFVFIGLLILLATKLSG